MVKKAMVFGVFDGLHEGHQYFLEEAQKLCEALVVVVTPDSIVEQLKKKLPLHNFAARAAAVRSAFPTARVVAGDTTLGSWQVLKEHTPNLLIFGYDQQIVKEAADWQKILTITVKPHKPHILKSSLLHRPK